MSLDTHLPDLGEVLASVRVVDIALQVPFRGLASREAALVRGPHGWGEFGPFVEYPDAEAAHWLAAALEAAWQPRLPTLRSSIEVNATVPAVPADAVADLVARFDGCTTAKVKVAEPGQGIGDDLDRVAAVRDALGPHGRIRLDANGGWDVGHARHAVRALSAYGLEYVEQPCASVADLAELRRDLARDHVDVLVAADESVRKAQDPLVVARAGAADIIVLKVAPLGGARRALWVAGECGLPVVVSSALDTSVGIRAGLEVAAALPDLPYACGLATVGLLAGDVTGDPLVADGGAIGIREVEVDDERLTRWAAPAARQLWWRERVTRCHALLSVGRAGGAARD